jgi:2,3-bisphosphoglycerate-dependent phosphoglycerate mutase
MDLILIRHGLPLRSEDSSDPPLSETGHAQARLVSALLQEEAIDAVWASTMRRAIETAEPFAAAAGLQIAAHDGIREYDRESGVYIPSEELKREDYAAWQAVVDRDMSEFRDTVVETLEGVVRENQGRRVAVFCHGGVINVWAAHVLKTPPRLFFNPTYCSVNRFSCARTGQRSVVSLGEAAHLKALAVEMPG